MYVQNSRRLGSWWNSWDDLVGDIQDGIQHFTGGSHNTPGMLPPGTRPFSPTNPSPLQPGGVVLPPDMRLTMSQSDDLQTLRDWTEVCRISEVVASRMPNGPTNPAGDTGNVGELAGRYDGPGTADPNHVAPFFFHLAPDNVRAADHRLAAGYAADRSGVILGTLQLLGIVPYGTVVDPTTGGPAGPKPIDYAQLLKYGAMGLGALLVLDVVLRNRD